MAKKVMTEIITTRRQNATASKNIKEQIEVVLRNAKNDLQGLCVTLGTCIGDACCLEWNDIWIDSTNISVLIESDLRN